MKKITFIITGLFAISSLFAQKQQDNNQTVVIPCSGFHITKPLSEIFANYPLDFSLQKKGESEDKKSRTPQKFKKSVKDGPQYGNDPSTMQREMGGVATKAPIANWTGQSATGFRPMDPSGAVGPNHYVQMINSTTFRIFNKTGGTLLTGTFGNLWTPPTGNAGDPVVLYDKAADRWFMSQFSSTNDFYIAISTTNDPTGAYYTYTYTSPAFPDYLKFSVWQDGYYMTSNQAQKVFCFERTAMLAGVPTARSLFTNFAPPQGGGFFVPLPGDAGDGALPPAGTPCPIFSYSDNGWGAGFSDAVNIYKMAVNWLPATPTATITLAGNIPTAAFDGTYNAGWNDCSQPGTAQKLDGIGGTLMFRAQWKTWAGYNSVVLNWGVLINAGTGQRSIKWCELHQDQTTGTWSMYQEGIYTPDAATRWMGSIAMDNNGAIGIAYLKSDATSIYPSLCYSGRRPCDPLGTLPITEVIAKAGTGSQTGVNRVGDYSQTSLDPDGVTFWHTGEYMGAGGTAGTQIFSFQLPTCGPTASVAIAGTSNICLGASVTFTATPTNGGTTPVYQWQVNGVNAGTNSSTFTTSTLTNGQVVTCIMTSNLAGVIGNPATSNAITMIVGSPVAAFTGTPTSTVCTGFVQFTDNSTGGITSWLWDFGDGQTATTQSPSHTYNASGTYTVTLTATNSCGSNQLIKTNYITISVPTLPVGTDGSRCGTGTVNLSATGSGVLHWFNAATGGTDLGTGAAFTTPSISATTPYYVEDHIVQASQYVGPLTTFAAGSYSNTAYTLTFDCLSASTLVSVAVDKQVAGNILIQLTDAANVVLQSGTYAVPAGASRVILNWPLTVATGLKLVGPINSGLWRVNIAGTFPYTLPGLVSITGCSSGTRYGSFFDWEIKQPDCVSSRTIVTATVNSSVAPTVSIAASPTGAICTGTNVTFTATPTNGGATPAYQWQVNGANVGANSATYSSSTLTNGQIVTCILTSNLSCAAPLTATSNAITMTVLAVGPPSVSIAALPVGAICTGTNVTFTATPTNGGTTPAYQWKLNGANVGTNSATYSNGTLANGDIVTCVLTSNSACASPTTATSNAITMTVNPVPSMPTAGSNTPVCVGTAINLTTPLVAGATYSWTGPNAFSSTVQNPSTAASTVAMAGTYSVTVTQSGCTSAAGTITVVVNPIPTTPTAGSNSPVCVGTAINLTTPLVAGATYSWTGPNGFTSTLQNPSTAASTMAMAGTYSITTTKFGCTSAAGTATVVVNPIPSTPSVISNSPVCVGTAINLTTPLVAGATYSWTGPNGFTSTLQNPSTAGSTAAMAGTYTVTVTQSGCVSAAGTTTVVVNPIPSTPTAGSNSPVCVGTAINLITPLVAGATYNWTGPNGFTSTLQNPSTAASTVAMAGTYSVTITQSGCTSAAGTAAVVVNPFPTTPTAGSNTPVCVGTAINLTTPLVAGATYSWTGPNGFTSTLQNPSTAASTMAMAGTYSITTTKFGCTSAAGTATVVVNPIPSTPTAGSNTPVCVGTAINLTTPLVAGATYSWTGPNGFTSTLQNPTTAAATVAMAGTYSVTVTQSGCTSAAGINSVVVNPIPSTPMAASNTPVCAGTAINLITPLVAGATYSWTGPNAFTSTLQNPSTAASTLPMAGTYSVTVTKSGCTSAAGTTTVVVNPIPSTPIVGSNTPVCVGAAINLTTPLVAGATYSWTGPNAFTSTLQNPSTAASTVSMAGTYSVTITKSGCTSAAGTSSVVVNPIPTSPTAGSNSPVCAGTAINLTTPLVAGTTYSWTGPNGFTSTLQTPSIAASTVAMAGTYSVTITQSGCTSAAGTTTVVVNTISAPSLSIAITAGSNPTCIGSNVTYTATPTNGGSTPIYQWLLNGVNTGSNSDTYSSTTLVNGDIVTCDLTSNSACASPSNATSNSITMTVTTTVAPAITIAALPNGTICSGTNVTFTATPTNGGTTPAYQWLLNGVNTGSNSATYSSSTFSNNDIVTCVLTSNSACASPTSGTSNAITMVVNPIPATPTAGSNSPVCEGTLINLTTPFVAGASYSWTGPNGFTSILQNPTTATSTVAMAGTYSVSVTQSGCTSVAGTTNVTVNAIATPSLTITVTSGSNPTCIGTNVTFTAIPTNGGSTPIYQWLLNGVSTGTNSVTYSSTTLANGDIVTCALTSNLACASPITATSNAITMTVTATVAPAVSIAAFPNGVICAGTNVTFTATPANGGTTPMYQWLLNGVNTGTGSATYSNTTLVNGDIVTCLLTSNSACASPTTSTSNPITVAVTATVTPTISIAALPNGAICTGTNVTFTATPTNEGTAPIYQWFLNGLNSGANSATYSSNTLVNGDIVTCGLTSNAACASSTTATSNAITITVTASVAPAVSITALPNGAVCIGTNVTFTATPTNGGTTPVYQWLLNGLNTGTNSATYSTPALANGDIVSCVLTSNSACASPTTVSSNAITMTVTATLAPAVSIAASPNGAICAGTNVIFTATPTNGGTTPAYQWVLNGANTGSNSATYSTTTLTNGDIVSCILTSNSACASPTTAASNAITMIFSSVNLTTSSTSVSCSGGNNGTATISASGGVAPYSYVWNDPAAQTLATATSLIAGNYSVTVTDSNGCSQIATVVVSQPTAIVLSTTSTNAICGINNGSATVAATGGTGVFSYLWNDASAQTTATAGALAAGTYTVTVTDNNSCSQAAIVQIISTSTISLTVSITKVSCKNGSDGQATVSVSGGFTPYTYLWSDPASQTTATASGLITGTYTIKVTDSVGCMQTVSVIVNEPPQLTVTSTQTNTICGDNSGSITVSAVGGTPPYVYFWNNGLATSTLTNIIAGSYFVLVNDANSCDLTDTITVSDEITEACLFIPNSFSPNGDGDHDLFVIEYLSLYQNVGVEIYNRWGNIVYSSSDYKNEWDGKRNGADLPGGVYYYIIDLNKGQKPVAGSLTILR